MTILVYFYRDIRTKEVCEINTFFKSVISFLVHWSTWLLILILAVIIFIFEKIPISVKTSETSIFQNACFTEEENPIDPDVHLLFTGDISLHERWHTLGTEPFAGVKDLFNRADLVVGNLESPLTLKSLTANKGRWGGGIHLRGDPSGAWLLKDAGFDLMSLANNHIGDYRAQGILDTINAIFRYGLAHCGAGANLDEACQPAFFLIKDRKFAFYAFCDVEPRSYCATPSKPGYAPAHPELIRKAIGSQPPEVFVVVIFHWGEDMKRTIGRQKKLALVAVESGADLVVGHHPHIVQRVEYIKGVPVAYSLGNFLFDTNQSAGEYGIALLVTIIPSCNDLQLEVVPIVNRNLQVQLARGKEAERILKRAAVPSPRF